MAERLRSAVASLYIPHMASNVSKFVTVSVGVATITPASIFKPEDLIVRADKALYLAKEKGRNRV